MALSMRMRGLSVRQVGKASATGHHALRLHRVTARRVSFDRGMKFDYHCSSAALAASGYGPALVRWSPLRKSKTNQPERWPAGAAHAGIHSGCTSEPASVTGNW